MTDSPPPLLSHGLDPALFHVNFKKLRLNFAESIRNYTFWPNFHVLLLKSNDAIMVKVTFLLKKYKISRNLDQLL